MKLLKITCMGLLSLLAFFPVNSLKADWSTPVQISPNSDPVSIGDVKVNATGNAIAVWSDFDGINSVIMTSRLPFGGSWSTVQTLSTTKSWVKKRKALNISKNFTTQLLRTLKPN